MKQYFAQVVIVAFFLFLPVSSALALWCHFCSWDSPAFSAYCVPGGTIHCNGCYSAGTPMFPSAVVAVTASPIVGQCRVFPLYNCNKNFPCPATCPLCHTVTVNATAVGVNECN